MNGTSDLPQATWVERTSMQAYRYHKRSRTLAVRPNDSYLRLDVACGVEGCPCCPPTSPALSASAPYLLIPDAASLGSYLEIFELPEVEGLVLLTSVMSQMQQGGNMQRTVRLRALYADKRRGNHLFDNLHHRETAPRGQAEIRQGMDMLAAADWYYHHLGERLPVVILSDKLASAFSADQQQQPPSSDGCPSSVGSSGGGQGQLGPCRLGSVGAPHTAAATQLGSPQDQEDELEVLLRQMDIGRTGAASSSSSRGEGGARAGCAGSGVPGSADGRGSLDAADSGLARVLDSLDLERPASPTPIAATPPTQQRGGEACQVVPKLVASGGSSGATGATLAPGVHILSAAQYFGGAAGVEHPPALLDIFDSIASSAAAAADAEARGQAGGSAGGSQLFPPHLSQAAIDTGLQDGSLLQGTLSVSRRTPNEATVRVGGGELGGARRTVLISGRAAVNRAVHGDTVAVRLLPREQWRPAEAVAAAAVAEDGEHELLAAAGAADGAEAAADEAAEPGVAAGREEEVDAMEDLFSSAAADALLPTAEVVGVLQRSGAEVVACLAEDDERALASRRDGRQESVLAVPLDRRLPKLRLRSRQLHRLLGQRLLLRLDGWERSSAYPHGHLVRVLGPINDLRAETDGLLAASGVHWQPFSEGALRELPPVASSAEYRIPAAELASRRDLRSPQYLICSIDPPGCTDVDDALSVCWMGGGSSSGAGSGGGSAERQLVEVGVHIADVSFFVRQGGLLDSEAASRCTTVYLVDRRLDMLPALLSEDLCSLRGGVDRYAVSVLWTLDADTLDLQSVWFGRTLIRSRYQLEYSQAQAIMEGRPATPLPGTTPVAASDLPALQRNLAFLARLAEHRRQQRLADGALELESAELRFCTDTAGQPTDVVVKQELPMMRIVAEMMIFANSAVAQRVAATFPRAALLRRHPPPRREAFEEVQALCQALLPPGTGSDADGLSAMGGLDLDGGPTALAASLAAACAAAPPALASLIRSLATRAMSEAEYFSTGDAMGRGGGGMNHYGLGLQYYTHFTSPIRRYADVVVHRQLLAAVAAGGHEAPLSNQPLLAAGGPPAAPPLPSVDLSARAHVMNERHRTAKRAQKDCSDLYFLLLLHARPHVEAATVYGFRGAGELKLNVPRCVSEAGQPALLVFVSKYHLRGVIHLTDKVFACSKLTWEQTGLCRPPLTRPEDADDTDPYVAAHRRTLEVIAGTQRLCIRRREDGEEMASFALQQTVWVELSADGSRAHGPSLQMRLLADSHPAVEAAARHVVQARAASAQVASPDQGCGTLPRGGPPAYRPPGITDTIQQQQRTPWQQQQKQPKPSRHEQCSNQSPPPPSFGPPIKAAERDTADLGQTIVHGQARQQQAKHAPPQPTIAAALVAALQEVGRATLPQQEPTTSCTRAMCAPDVLPPGPALLPAAVQNAMGRLERRASRASVLAAASAPAGLRAQERALKAIECRQQLVELRQQLLAVECKK